MPIYLEISMFATIVCGVLLICVSGSAQSGKSNPKDSDRFIYPGDFGYNHSPSSNNQYVHYELPNFPRDEDYDDGPSQKPTTNNSSKNVNDAISQIWNVKKDDAPKIPISFINEINSQEYTVNDLLLHYVEDYDDTDLSTRFGDERSGITAVKEAKCMPELRSINLIENMDPSVLFIPTCIRVERCGGCCMHEMLSCQAKEVETINVKVIKVMYTGGRHLKYAEKQIIPVDVHKSCKCDCKIRPEDCTPMQVYEKSECKCGCKNTDEEKKCRKENSTKLWNSRACACQCREELMCTTGSIFDWKECKCIVKQIRRRNVDVMTRNRYRNRALSVAPFSDDYIL